MTEASLIAIYAELPALFCISASYHQTCTPHSARSGAAADRTRGDFHDRDLSWDDVWTCR
jgi:hypothetical protein